MAERYYWYKIKEDFFDSDKIMSLKEMEDGDRALAAYLELCGRSLKNNGKLIRKIGNKNVTLSVTSIANLLRIDKKVAEKLIGILQEVGLIVNGKDGMYLPDLPSMIGSESAVAARVRRHREKALHCNTDVTAMKQSSNTDVTEKKQKCNVDIDIDIDIDKEKEYKEKESVTNNVFSIWNNNMFPRLDDIVKGELLDLIAEYGEPKVIYAIRQASQYGKKSYAYVRSICVGKKGKVPFGDLEYEVRNANKK